MTIQQIADEINQGGYGFVLMRLGAGWPENSWGFADRQSGIVEHPTTEENIRAKFLRLTGIDTFEGEGW
jgi:hypothetical protein